MKKDFCTQIDSRIILKEKGKTHFIEVDEITHLTCDGYLTTVHTIENRTVIVSKLLKHFEIELAEHGFLRANHFTLVNSKNIISFQCGFIRSVTLVNKKEIQISRRKMFILRKYLFNNNE